MGAVEVAPQDPKAWERSLSERISRQARALGADATTLRQTFVITHLVSRLVAANPDQWIIKGGTALALRNPEMRFTGDLDAATALSAEEAVDAIADISDDPQSPFTFVVQPVTKGLKSIDGAKLSVEAFIGRKKFCSFSADIVKDQERLFGQVELVHSQPLIDSALPEFPRMPLYPIEDHVADKFSGLYKPPMRKSGEVTTSTRTRDLADLALISEYCEVDMQAVILGLREREGRSPAPFPEEIVLPSQQWTVQRWEKDQHKRSWRADLTMDTALEEAKAFGTPILQAYHSGDPLPELRWSPKQMRWGSGQPSTQFDLDEAFAWGITTARAMSEQTADDGIFEDGSSSYEADRDNDLEL